MINKRGQTLSINTIIIIILAIVVLVVLILGFTLGWQKLLPFLGGSDNVNEIVSSCDIACNTNAVYDYCSRERILQADDLPGGLEEVTGTCKSFSTTPDYLIYKINACPGLC